MRNIKSSILYADSARGVYIPQYFAESVNWNMLDNWDEDQRDILLAGPDHELYWDVWCEVLDNVTTADGGVLHQDGDLWIVYPDAMRDAIDAYCEQQRDYEESHEDAGNNYAHMPAESWIDTDTQELIRQLRDGYEIPQWQALGVNPAWQFIDPDTLATLALECFEMVPEYGLVMPSDCIILASYPIGEIEIDLSGFWSADGIAFDFVSENCDAYISGDLGYITSDIVWCARLNIEKFNAAIEESLS